MCGIAGCLSLREGVPPVPTANLHAMLGALRHRGPDGAGSYRDDQMGMGQTRLSIVDLAGGTQPMADESGSRWLVFNGEIFNYVELRHRLEGLGHRFRTHSDTEVILHAFERWGYDAFERFNGQFALALWDQAARTLVLARDRLGVRPLFLCEHEGRLWFASEVKALFAGAPGIPRAFDTAGLRETFTFWASVAPQSVFAGIDELEPGVIRTIGPKGTVQRHFWSPGYPVGPARTYRGSLRDAVEDLRSSLEAAVKLRILQADVPVGAYLSGGLDSSLIAALGHHVKGDRFSTFSIRFDDPEFDETDFQRQMAAHIGSDHRELVVRRQDIAEVFPDVVAHAERPLLRTAPAPLFLLSRLVHESGIKVVLTGEGADEMFAGYDIFREARIRRFWGRQPASTMRPLLLERLYPYLNRSPVASRTMAREFFGRDRTRWAEPGFAHHTRWGAALMIERLLSPDRRADRNVPDVTARLLGSVPEVFSTWSYLAQDQYLEIRTLLSGYLLSSQGDRMLMAHSVEGRFPFLDMDVVALADSLPDTYKLQGLSEKHIVKRMAAGLVPDAIVQRTKQPYRAPDARSFLGSDAPAWIEGVLDPSALREAGVFDPVAVERLWRKLRSATAVTRFSNADNMAIVAILSTGLLHDRLMRTPPVRQTPPRFDVVVDRVIRRDADTTGLVDERVPSAVEA